MMKRFWLAGALFGLLASGPVGADVWDTSGERDNDAFTDNQVSHGTVQTHDLAAVAAVADQDWYRVQTRPFSSYEFVIEGMTGDTTTGGPGNPTLERIAGDGVTVLGAGVGMPGQFAYSQTLRWENSTSNELPESVRVANAACSTGCTVTSSSYTARFFETSTSIARFNNSGSQITVLLLQNPATYPIAGRIYYWNAAGTLIASQTFAANPKQLITVATGGVTGATSGSITITQDGRYGDLQGKSVALEPSTGFSFDTPMAYRSN